MIYNSWLECLELNNTMKYQSLDEIIREYLLSQEKERAEKIDNDWWWASELGTCMRKQFLRRLGLPPKQKEWRISFLAEMGKSSHEWVINSARSMGCLIDHEGELRDEELRYKGRFDLIVDLNPGNLSDHYYSLIDIKTQRPEAFFRRMRSPKGDRVKSFQKMQLASYFLFAKRKYPNLKDARIYYLDRGGGVRDEYVFKFSKSMEDEVIKELKALNKYWEEKQLPPCSNSFVCEDYCRPYKNILAKVEQGELSLEELINYAKTKNKERSGPQGAGRLEW